MNLTINPEQLAKAKSIFMKVWIGWLLLSTSLVTAGVWSHPNQRAMFFMVWGLILLWVLGFGTLCLRFGLAMAERIRSLPFPWMIRFVLACTTMALLEEAVTVSMTNLAPVFGSKIGDAYITASANYFDVVLFHSVSIFTALFIGWSVILRYVNFSPWQAFFVFGITGTLCEMNFGGPGQIVAFAMWIPVYGWMVYLPTLSLTARPTAKPPKWWHFPIAVFAPLPFAAIFFALAFKFIAPPYHPSIHFPPIH